MGIPFTLPMGFLFTVTMGILLTISKNIRSRPSPQSGHRMRAKPQRGLPQSR